MLRFPIIINSQNQNPDLQSTLHLHHQLILYYQSKYQTFSLRKFTHNNSTTMKNFAIQILALLATGALAMPNQLEVRQHGEGEILTRDGCAATLPSCSDGKVVGQTNCRCDGMHPTMKSPDRCDVWVCPGNSKNIVSLQTMSTLSLTSHILLFSCE